MTQPSRRSNAPKHRTERNNPAPCVRRQHHATYCRRATTVPTWVSRVVSLVLAVQEVGTSSASSTCVTLAQRLDSNQGGTMDDQGKQKGEEKIHLLTPHDTRTRRNTWVSDEQCFPYFLSPHPTLSPSPSCLGIKGGPSPRGSTTATYHSAGAGQGRTGREARRRRVESSPNPTHLSSSHPFPPLRSIERVHTPSSVNPFSVAFNYCRAKCNVWG